MGRWIVTAGGFASLAACVGLAIGVAPASPAGSGAWSNVEGPNPLALSAIPSAVRGQDGSLFAAFGDANGDLAVSKVGAGGTRLSTEVAIRDGGTSPGPAIVRDPTSGVVRVMYGGFRSPPGESGTWSATAPAAGTPWSPVAKIANLSGATTVAAGGLDGTVFLAQAGGVVSLHRGTNPADPDHIYQPTCCSQNAGLAVDGTSGAPYVAWITGSPDRRLTVRQGSASTGEPVGDALEAPRLAGGGPADAIVEQRVQISGRIGLPGVYVAYGDRDTDTGELLLWRVGDPAPRRVAIVDGSIDHPALAPAPDGSLWIMWYEDASVDKISARQLRADGSTLGPITRLDLPPVAGFQTINHITGAAQADRLDLIAAGSQRHLHHTQILSVPPGGGPPGGGPAGGGPGTTTGALSGRVTQRDGRPVPDALVEACPKPSGQCLFADSGPDGSFLFDGLPPGSYQLTAHTPPNSLLTPTSRPGPSAVVAGQTTAGQDIAMAGPLRRPRGVTLGGAGHGEVRGIPVIRRNSPLVVLVDLGDDIVRSYVNIYDVPEIEEGKEPPPPFIRKELVRLPGRRSGGGTYCDIYADLCEEYERAIAAIIERNRAMAEELRRLQELLNCNPRITTCLDRGEEDKGVAVLGPEPLQQGTSKYWVACVESLLSGGGITSDCFNIWIDPSGYVRTTRGEGLPGAKVVLLRSDAPGGPFTEVANGSTVMSPKNRRNPDRTDSTGHFGWDVVSGYYKVTATKARCTDPANRRRKQVETRVYEIPPPVFDIDLRLRCPAPPRLARKQSRPRVKGKARVDRRLTCVRGKWKGKPKRYRYVWRRGRSYLADARTRRYRVRSQDRHARLRCEVLATNAYGTTSAASKPVRVKGGKRGGRSRAR